MQQMMYNGYTITNNGKYYSVKGCINTFFSLESAKDYVDKITKK